MTWVPPIYPTTIYRAWYAGALAAVKVYAEWADREVVTDMRGLVLTSREPAGIVFRDNKSRQHFVPACEHGWVQGLKVHTPKWARDLVVLSNTTVSDEPCPKCEATQ
jgi:hypothetical protein